MRQASKLTAAVIFVALAGTALAKNDKDKDKVEATLTAPANGALFTAPAAVIITATATAKQKNHPVVKVEFFAGTALIGTGAGPVTGDQYSFTWPNVVPGIYSLTAKATNDKGDTDTSDPISITVNARPRVNLTAPAANQVFNAPATVTVTAAASDSDGTISKVDFFDGTTLVATSATPYSVTLSNVAVGSHSYTAVATDNRGATAASSAVAILVNALPTVSISSPAADQLFNAPANIVVSATASDADGTVQKVDFFGGATHIGTATASPFSVTLANAALGVHNLTAVVTDNVGAQSTSATVAITVNALPAVSLTAPLANASFRAPANITITAAASDSDGSVAQVEFFEGTNLIATRTVAPYSIVWTGVPQGSFTLSARVTDNRGTVSASVPVAITVARGQLQAYYIHVDHLGSPREIYDQRQRLVWRYLNFEPFGANAPDEDPSGLGAFTCNLRFPGQYFDKETGLHYNMFRDFDPDLGRYRQSDPIGLRGGVNTYAYASSPIEEVDLYGLMGSRGTVTPNFTVRRAGSVCGAQGGTTFPNEWTFFGANWNFQRPCDAHDNCYATGCAPRRKCDSDFHDDMVSQCDRIPPASAFGFARSICRVQAIEYFTAVVVFGGPNYNSSGNACPGCPKN